MLDQHELSLASLVPTVEINGAFVLNCDASMAYGFEITPLPFHASAPHQINSIAHNMSELLRRLPDGYSLQLIVDVNSTRPQAVSEFMNKNRQYAEIGDGPSAYLAEDLYNFTSNQFFRNVHYYLFVCHAYAFQNTAMVRKGFRSVDRPKMDGEFYSQAVQKLIEIAQIVKQSFSTMTFKIEELSEEKVLKFIQKSLNPNRFLPMIKSGKGYDADCNGLTEGLPNNLYPQLTLREQLCHTDFDVHDHRCFQAGSNYVRVLSLSNLPDQTYPTTLVPLFFSLQPNCRFSITVERLPTQISVAGLKFKQNFAATAARAGSVDGHVTHKEIEDLMFHISQSSLSLCTLQLHVAIFGKTPQEVISLSEQAEQEIGRTGISTFYEDYAHVDAYLSMLPGASHRFRRTRTITDLNASHMLLPFGSWTGTKKSMMLLRSRSGDAVTYNPFSDELSAFNGLVIGATGSGKSFFVNLMLANHLANGNRAIVVDIGGSYRRNTEIFNGQYIDVGGKNTIGLNPFPPPATLARYEREEQDSQLLFLSGFLELLLCPNPMIDEQVIISRLLTAFYRNHQHEINPPSLQALKDFFKNYDCIDMNESLRTILVQRFDLWIGGPKSRHFELPFDITMSHAMVSIDLKAIENDKQLQAVALYVLSYVIWSKLSSTHNHKPTMIIFDECWALLNNPSAMKLIENLVRTARKYGAGLWCLSQSIDDFTQSAIGPALFNNSHSRILLRHTAEHGRVAEQCNLGEYATQAFKNLTSVKGQYSEIYLQCLPHNELLQVIPSPLGYWMATTNAKDKSLEEQTIKNNPDTSRINVLISLAEKYPHGA